MFVPPSGSGACYPVVKACVFGSDAKTGLLDDVSVTSRSEGDSGSSVRQGLKLVFCAAGLQVRSLLNEMIPVNPCALKPRGPSRIDTSLLRIAVLILALTVSSLAV